MNDSNLRDQIVPAHWLPFWLISFVPLTIEFFNVGRGVGRSVPLVRSVER